VASIVQRLLGFAQSAALAGEQGKAQGFLETARGIDPAAPGLRETGQLVAQWTRMVTTQRIKEHLETASQALQSGKLAGPDMPNALDLFDSVLKLDTGSDAARQGRRLVLEALLERAWSQIRADQFALAADTIHQAERAGVEARIVGVLRDELDYQTTLVRARDGEFERLHHLSELEIRRREVPAYPRNASGSGWVEVHFTVSQEGEVVAAVVHESSSEVFHATSLRAINHWRFKPLLVAGRPIPVRSAVRFSFQE
jgi:TonB family protein